MEPVSEQKRRARGIAERDMKNWLSTGMFELYGLAVSPLPSTFNVPYSLPEFPPRWNARTLEVLAADTKS